MIFIFSRSQDLGKVKGELEGYYERMKALTVRSGKGDKDRITTFPSTLVVPLKEHLARVKLIHQQDLAEGFGEVYLPHGLARKFTNAAKAWEWQYVFPAAHRSIDPRTGKERRHHLDPSPLNNAVRKAARQAGITKRVSAHVFRHSSVAVPSVDHDALLAPEGSFY